MLNTFLFLHLLGSTAAGFYLLLPFLTRRLSGVGSGQSGYAGVLVTANRIGQYLLILQFITGGYMISKADYTYVWMALVIGLFLVIAAFAGIMGKPLKRIRDGIQNSKDGSKVHMFAFLISIAYLVMLFIMRYPMYN